VRAKPGEKAVDMGGFVSQEYIKGEEYTVDVFCDIQGVPVYVIPRRRLAVESGLSTRGEVVKNDEVIRYVREICSHTHLVGPSCLQCICSKKGIFFTEINPRFCGGSSLAMEATENWYTLIRRMYDGEDARARVVKWGLVMVRYYADLFVNKKDILKSND
jgi:carbamoyl-phosphate synthase large subunit